MSFEPQNKFWIEPTREELAKANAQLRSVLVAVFIVAATGWGLFIWGILK